MKKGLIIGIIIAAIILMIVGYFYFNSSPVVEKAQGSGEEGSAITIKNFNFNPTTVNIDVNQTVIWRNEDNVPHTIVADNEEFNSETLNDGDSFSFKFENPGTYNYHCSIHPSMKGIVIVR